MKGLLKNNAGVAFDILSIGYAKSKFFPILTRYQENGHYYYYLFDKFLICKTDIGIKK